jgi:hypothetical protein
VALRAQEVTRLTTQYGLTDEQTRGILVEPEKHLPSLLANLHVNVADHVIQTIMKSLPDVVSNMTQQTTQMHQAQQEFYTAWPSLKEEKYVPMIASAIRAYRALNPKASRQEVIRAAGLNALITLRLPIPRELLMEPAAPLPEPASFVHAAPGAGGPPPASPQPQNPFQLLNEELDREDRG